MVPDPDEAEQDYASYQLLVELWAGENPVKTLKLQVLLLVNAILVAAMSLSGGPVIGNWPLYLTGASFSLLWAISLGRTVLFQEAWRYRAREIADRHPGDTRFQVLDGQRAPDQAPRLLRALGSVPSGYYLLGTPVTLCLFWLGVLAYLLL